MPGFPLWVKQEGFSGVFYQPDILYREIRMALGECNCPVQQILTDRRVKGLNVEGEEASSAGGAVVLKPGDHIARTAPLIDPCAGTYGGDGSFEDDLAHAANV